MLVRVFFLCLFYHPNWVSAPKGLGAETWLWEREKTAHAFREAKTQKRKNAEKGVGSWVFWEKRVGRRVLLRCGHGIAARLRLWHRRVPLRAEVAARALAQAVLAATACMVMLDARMVLSMRRTHVGSRVLAGCWDARWAHCVVRASPPSVARAGCAGGGMEERRARAARCGEDAFSACAAEWWCRAWA